MFDATWCNLPQSLPLYLLQNFNLEASMLNTSPSRAVPYFANKLQFKQNSTSILPYLLKGLLLPLVQIKFQNSEM